MLLAYQCSNFKSIGDKISFSMVASSDDCLKNNTTEFGGKKYLREAIIYGGNGTGKSNVIDSLGLLRHMIVNSHKNEPGSKLPTNVNKKMEDKNTEYQIQFITNGKRFLYGLSYNQNRVEEEFLYYYPNDRISKIFDRKENDITFGEKFKKLLSTAYTNFMKDNNLFFSCATMYSNVEEIKDAFLFFKNDLVYYSDGTDWTLYSAGKAENDGLQKEEFLKFLSRIGMNDIIGLTSKIDNKKISDKERELLKLILDKKEDNFHDEIKKPIIKFEYKDYTLDISDQSLGIQKLFQVFFPIYDIIIKNRVLIIDEFETHMHPLIVRELLNLFQSSNSSSQIIFSTHDVNLLDLSIFRRDQIWFTEKTLDNFTDLYSLAELKNVRNNENVSRNYLLGKYSGIPMINRNIELQLFKEIQNG